MDIETQRLQQRVSELEQQLSASQQEQRVALQLADQLLIENEERFVKAFQAIPDALVISRLADGRIIEINESFERLFGYPRGQVIGKTSLELAMFRHPQDRERAIEQLHRVGFLRDFEIEIRTARGDSHPVCLSAEKINIHSEDHLLTIIEDRTEQKQREASLRESEEMLRLALAAGQAGAWSWDLTTNALQWSDEYFRIFGFQPGSFQPTIEAGLLRIHQEDLPQVEAAIRHAVDHCLPIDVVHRLIWPDGSLHWVRGVSRVFDDESGKPVRMAGLAIDITAQKQAELQLHTAHERVREILESINDAFYSLDNNGCFTYVNQKAASLWNKRPADLLGKNIWEVFPSGKETESYHHIQQALSRRQFMQYESYSAFLDQWVEIHIYPTEQGVSVYFQDISDRKRAERALAETAKTLERSNQELEQFAYTASHDLQEPLRKIEGFGDILLKKSTNLNAQQRDYIERMRFAAERLRHMVDGLLQLSRINTQGRSFSLVDLSQVAANVLADLDFQVRQTGAAVELGSLPEVDGDPLQLHQLFQNLIANSLKFHRPGVAPLVKVHSSQFSAGVQIVVEDNGIGFDPAQAEQMFLPFARLVSRSEYEGSGMGLAICRRIVERHRGEISAASAGPGLGATFRVTLPRPISLAP